MDEIIEDTNCITKAFENHPIFIFKEMVDNKKQYYFRASDVGKVLDIVNVRVSIQNYDEDEVVVRKAYTLKGERNVLFLTSGGVYRLLYSSKKKIAKEFRKWASAILDDIIFNDSNELRKQLDAKDLELEEKNKQLKISENKNLNLVSKITEVQTHKINGWLYLATNDQYALKNHFRLGRTGNLQQRLRSYRPGRTVADNLYYVYIFRSENIHLLELLLRELLVEYRENPAVDIYVIPWPILHQFVKYICNMFHSGIIVKKNELIIDNINFNEDPLIPKRINNIKDFTDDEEIDCTECYDDIEYDEEDNIEKLTEVFEDIIIEKNGVSYVKDKVSVDNVTRKCRSCKDFKDITLFELVSSKGARKNTCLECFNKTDILCKQCNIPKLATNFRFSKNDLRQRRCNECLDAPKVIFKVCEKCHIKKPNSDFDSHLDKYNKMVKYNSCKECYKPVNQGNSKTCTRCEKVLPKDQFVDRLDGARNRICNGCRKI
jgi:prophage antirepressor-like protein